MGGILSYRFEGNSSVKLKETIRKGCSFGNSQILFKGSALCGYSFLVDKNAKTVSITAEGNPDEKIVSWPYKSIEGIADDVWKKIHEIGAELEERKTFRSDTERLSSALCIFRGSDTAPVFEELPEEGTDEDYLVSKIVNMIVNNAHTADAAVRRRTGIAAPSVFRPQVIIVTGKAGTGKTRILTGLLGRLSGERSPMVMAPTGRAADVINLRKPEGTSDAKTIHRSIYLTSRSIEQAGSLPYFVFRMTIVEEEDAAAKGRKVSAMIVDESSMIPSTIDVSRSFQKRSENDNASDTLIDSGSILADIMEYAMRHHIGTVVFFGDDAQLPPVGEELSEALAPYDLYERFGCNVNTFVLRHVYRQDGAILNYANAFRGMLEGGSIPSPEKAGEGVYSISLQNGIDSYVRDALHLATPVEKAEKLSTRVFIAAANKSVMQLNTSIRALLGYPENEPIPGDIIMICSNSYADRLKEQNGLQRIAEAEDDGDYFDEDVFNGNRIIVTSVKDADESDLSADVVGWRRAKGLRFYNIVFDVIGYDRKKDQQRLVCLKETLKPTRGGRTQRLDTLMILDFCKRNGISNTRNLWRSDALVEEMADDYWMQATECMFGYAMTGHKSQGGEWDDVFIKYDPMKSMTLNGYIRWCYTVTARAKNNLFVINAPDYSSFRIPSGAEDRIAALKKENTPESREQIRYIFARSAAVQGDTMVLLGVLRKILTNDEWGGLGTMRRRINEVLLILLYSLAMQKGGPFSSVGDLRAIMNFLQEIGYTLDGSDGYAAFALQLIARNALISAGESGRAMLQAIISFLPDDDTIIPECFRILGMAKMRDSVICTLSHRLREEILGRDSTFGRELNEDESFALDCLKKHASPEALAWIRGEHELNKITREEADEFSKNHKDGDAGDFLIIASLYAAADGALKSGWDAALSTKALLFAAEKYGDLGPEGILNGIYNVTRYLRRTELDPDFTPVILKALDNAGQEIRNWRKEENTKFFKDFLSGRKGLTIKDHPFCLRVPSKVMNNAFPENVQEIIPEKYRKNKAE